MATHFSESFCSFVLFYFPIFIIRRKLLTKIILKIIPKCKEIADIFQGFVGFVQMEQADSDIFRISCNVHDLV